MIAFAFGLMLGIVVGVIGYRKYSPVIRQWIAGLSRRGE